MSLLLMRKGLRLKLFEERFYELTDMKAQPMVKERLWTYLCVSFVQLPYFTKFKRYIY